MTTYNTGNPVGSTDPRDLFDNAENLDDAVNGTDPSWVDRLGVTRKSWKGIEDDASALNQSVQEQADATLAAVEAQAGEILIGATEQADRAEGYANTASEAADAAAESASEAAALHGRLVELTLYEGAGIHSWPIPDLPDGAFVRFRMQAPGGGGGAAQDRGSSQATLGSAGGPGAFADFTVPLSDLTQNDNDTVTVTIGARGSAGLNGKTSLGTPFTDAPTSGGNVQVSNSNINIQVTGGAAGSNTALSSGTSLAPTPNCGAGGTFNLTLLTPSTKILRLCRGESGHPGIRFSDTVFIRSTGGISASGACGGSRSPRTLAVFASAADDAATTKTAAPGCGGDATAIPSNEANPGNGQDKSAWAGGIGFVEISVYS